jgi:CopG family nickel-responsive transcriptional regulator
VRRFADAVIAERGVHHGALNLIVAEAAGEHRHGHGHKHVHLKPRH